MTLAVALVSFAMSAEPAADALPPSLSLPEAEETFLTRGLDLLIAEEAARGAEGDLTAAGDHPNPNLGLTLLYGPPAHRDLLGGELGPPAGPVSQTWGFAATLGDNAALEDQLSGKRSLRIEATSKALAAARIGVEDLKRTELSQLRQAYVAAVMAGLNVAAASDSFDTFDRQLKLNQVRFDKGAISGLDLSRILQAQLEAQQVLEQARAGQAQAMASLAFLLGARSGAPEMTLTTGIDYRAFAQMENATAAGLLELALKNRTDVKIAEQTLAQKEIVLRQARRAVFPDIQLQIGYSEQCNSATCSSAPTISAGLQGNLPILAQQQGQIKRALSDVAGTRRALDKARAQALSDVTQSHAAYSASRRLVARMEEQLLAQAKKSRDLAQLMYQKGAASLIDFLDAQRTYLATVLEHNQDLAAYWASVYQLEQATATPLR